MKRMESLALRWDGVQLWVLDQRLLPQQEVWREAREPEVMTDLIRNLAVRGAPLIGVAAALCLGARAEQGASKLDIERDAQMLRASRPTAVNLMWAVDRMLESQKKGDPVREAEAIFEEDVALCEGMAHAGASLIQEGEGIVTHCNTGGLATVGRGTALGVIHLAHEQGKALHVFVDETRPLLQGGRLTAWECARLGIPHTLITDSMAAILMREGRVQRVFVGADRIARNGDFANKVGTYGLSVQARYHGIPFHPVAPYSTVDLNCPHGRAIPIEQRDPEEVRGFAGRIRWAPDGVPVFNPSFDVTPVANVTSLVLDRGIISREALQEGALEQSSISSKQDDAGRLP